MRAKTGVAAFHEPTHRSAGGSPALQSPPLLATARIALLLCAFYWGLCCVALGEPRFPPPEFEAGYKLPETQAPVPRALLMQYLDVSVLAATLGLATYLVFKKRSRNGVLGLSLFSLAYFGFYRKGCVCSIGSLQNVALGLSDASYAVPLTVTVFFLAPLIVALFAGRTFCAAVCPHGALQDLMLLKPVKVPAWLEQALGILPFVYLGAGVLFAATGSAFIICEYDPFVPLFRRSGSAVMLLTGAVFLLLAMFVGRPYCRFLCPYGALLRLASGVSKWRVTVTPDSCTRCRLCEESCPFGAIQEPASATTSWLTLLSERKRLALLVALLPGLILAGGWLGAKLSVAASRKNPKVELAEQFARHGSDAPKFGVQTAARLALMRAGQNPEAIVAAALAVRQRFSVGGWLFGGWVGLVIGAKLIGLSVRHARRDYEPNRATCFACARCFSSCPNERTRLGLLPINVGALNPSAQTIEATPTVRCR